MEKWISFGDDLAYAEAAVTGREADLDGLRDLLASTVGSMTEIPADG